MDALDGLINAHVLALRAQGDEGARAFTAGVVNDALEVAATRVEGMSSQSTLIEIANAIRGLKRNIS